MKKTIFLLICFSFTLSLSVYSQKARVGIAGGFTISNMNSNIDGKKETGNSQNGFMASLLVETPIVNHIAFQPHLSYVRKGMKLKQAPNATADSSIQLRYVDLPMNVVFTTGKSFTFYIGGGPVFSFNLPSMLVSETGGLKSTTEITFGTEATDSFRGFDFGVNGIAGIRLKNGFFLAVNYTQGLRNLSPMENATNTIHNNYAGIQIGYLFNNNNK